VTVEQHCEYYSVDGTQLLVKPKVFRRGLEKSQLVKTNPPGKIFKPPLYIHRIFL